MSDLGGISWSDTFADCPNCWGALLPRSKCLTCYGTGRDPIPWAELFTGGRLHGGRFDLFKSGGVYIRE